MLFVFPFFAVFNLLLFVVSVVDCCYRFLFLLLLFSCFVVVVVVAVVLFFVACCFCCFCCFVVPWLISSSAKDWSLTVDECLEGIEAVGSSVLVERAHLLTSVNC